MLRPFLLFFLILLAAPSSAQQSDRFAFGGDAYMAGRTVSNATEGVDDLFAMGEKVISSAPLAGTAYLFGRRVLLSGPVAGSAMLAGQNIDITGPIGGDLRAMGQDVTLNAPVAGSGLIAAQSLVINGAVEGDLGLGGDDISFGPDARVGGQLHLFGHGPESIDIPTRVAPPERIVWHESQHLGGLDNMNMQARPGFWTRLKGFVGRILVVGVLATLLAAIAPGFVASVREQALQAPLRTGWIGFLALSAAMGSLVVVAMTWIGLVLVPVSVLLSVLMWLVGYLVGAYVLGVAIAGLIGRARPDTLGERAIAAFVGAAGAALLGLIPFIGWLVWLALALFGAGGVIVHWFAPGFYSEPR